MGYESYNFRIKLTETVYSKLLINNLLEVGYDYVIQNDSMVTLEKNYESGIVEVQTLKPYLEYSFRIAKPNKESVIIDFMKDIINLSKLVAFKLYDVQLKCNINFNNYDDLIFNFAQAREEFLKYYPHNTPPIRCEDVMMLN